MAHNVTFSHCMFLFGPHLIQWHVYVHGCVHKVSTQSRTHKQKEKCSECWQHFQQPWLLTARCSPNSPKRFSTTVWRASPAHSGDKWGTCMQCGWMQMAEFSSIHLLYLLSNAAFNPASCLLGASGPMDLLATKALHINWESGFPPKWKTGNWMTLFSEQTSAETDIKG